MSEKKLKKIRFCRNSNFIRESTESAVRGCSSVNSQGKYQWRRPVIVKLKDLSL